MAVEFNQIGEEEKTQIALDSKCKFTKNKNSVSKNSMQLALKMLC